MRQPISRLPTKKRYCLVLVKGLRTLLVRGVWGVSVGYYNIRFKPKPKNLPCQNAGSKFYPTNQNSSALNFRTIPRAARDFKFL